MTTVRHCALMTVCTVSLLSVGVLFLMFEQNHKYYVNQGMASFNRTFRFREFVARQEVSSPATGTTTNFDIEATSITSTLELKDIMDREQERRQRTLASACRNLNISEPTDSHYSHLIVNDVHKILFNFIPKVSCKTWKHIWNQLYKQNATGHLMLGQYKSTERNARLASYRKVLFVREPMSRLLSAYMSKFRGGALYNHGPLQRTWEKMYGRDIARRYRSVPYHELKDGEWLNITLVELIKYVTDLGSGIPLTPFNDHWMPQYIVSCPCHIKYDFIGHFENLAVEGPYALRLLGVDHLVQFPEYQSSNAVVNIVDYYKSVPLDLLQELVTYYKVDYKLFGYLPNDVIDQVIRGVFEENNT